MGNAALCAPSLISSSTVKVLSIDGKLTIHTREPLKAAEIMLENPGQFLCESAQLRVGQRITGMCAEEDLYKGQLYFLLPMEMLYSVLTDDLMNSLSLKTSKDHFFIKQAASTLSFSKIFPEIFCLFPNSNNSEGKIGSGAEEGETFCRQRSWEPSLDTIVETLPHT